MLVVTNYIEEIYTMFPYYYLFVQEYLLSIYYIARPWAGNGEIHGEQNWNPCTDRDLRSSRGDRELSRLWEIKRYA